jgi:predicted DNA-binding transcriptional regulator AlpA
MASAVLDLPADLARHRILDSREAASLCKFSLPHWRRLYRAGSVPKPLKLRERKLGWRAGDLTDWLAERAAQAA